MRLGCKPICIIDRPILGRASLALLNQTGCCRGLLRSAPRSLCMNSWTYGAPLSIVSACPLQSFTFDIGFALSLPVPPYNAPSSTPHDRGPWTTTNDERRGNPSPTTLATEQIWCGSRHALETASALWRSAKHGATIITMRSSRVVRLVLDCLHVPHLPGAALRSR